MIPHDRLARAAAEPRPQPRRRRRRAARRGARRAPSCCCAPTCWPRASAASGPETLDAAGRDAQRAACTPSCPSQGSVGASGDLAPLAHLALAPDRRRRVLHLDGRTLSGGRGAARAPACAPVTLQAKEGLALINGTQLMTAVAGAGAGRGLAAGAHRGRRRRPDARCAEGHRRAPSIRASTPRARIPARRRRRATCASCSAGSAIRESHRDCGEVQDAYSLRCMPQVHGAVRDALDFVTRRRRRSRSTPPPTTRWCSPRPGELALRRQLPRRAGGHRRRPAGHRVAELGGISERRTERLVNPALSGPARLPHPRRRAPVGLHDRPRHRRRPRLREQGARPSRPAWIRSRPPPTRRTTSRWG